MSDHFNKLSPAEAERLACLMEECGEVVQVIGKILRHGYEDWSPHDESKTTNRRNLEREVGDLAAVVDKLINSGDLSEHAIEEASDAKAVRMRAWTHHQPDSERALYSEQAGV